MKNWQAAGYVFSGAYCVLYVVALAFDLPAFLYYPVTAQVDFGAPDPGRTGVAMAWYGLVVTAAAGALVVAAIVPIRTIPPSVRSGMWLVATLAMLACAFLMRGFFR